MGDIIQFPTRFAQFRRELQYKIRQELVDVPEPFRTQIEDRVTKSSEECLKEVSFRFEVKPPPDMDPADVEKLKGFFAMNTKMRLSIVVDRVRMEVSQMLARSEE